MATLTADQKGVVKGKFKIPANIPAGSKLVEAKGVANGGNSSAIFTGQGVIDVTTKRKVTVNNYEYLDPLAQTFVVVAPRQISGVDLWFTDVGTADVIVQIRSTNVGFPTQEVLCEGRVKAADIKKGQWTNIKFTEPYYAKTDAEYSMVIMSNDPKTACAISELGQFDQNKQQYVASMTYNVGVLLSSINASTWTAHQSKKLAFRMYARKYTESNKIIDLGSVQANNITDIVLSGLIENPETNSDGQYQVLLPDGTSLSMSNQQAVKLTKAISGPIRVSAIIRSNGTTSAKLLPGTQLLLGTISTGGVYVTRAINGNAAGCRVQARFLAAMPSGSSVKVLVSGNSGTTWTEIPSAGSPVIVDNNFGVYEYTYAINDIKAAAVQVKIEITGSAAARPAVYNLRVNVI